MLADHSKSSTIMTDHSGCHSANHSKLNTRLADYLAYLSKSNASMGDKSNTMLADHLAYENLKSKSNTILCDHSKSKNILAYLSALSSIWSFEIEYLAGWPLSMAYDFEWSAGNVLRTLARTYWRMNGTKTISIFLNGGTWNHLDKWLTSQYLVLVWRLLHHQFDQGICELYSNLHMLFFVNSSLNKRAVRRI